MSLMLQKCQSSPPVERCHHLMMLMLILREPAGVERRTWWVMCISGLESSLTNTRHAQSSEVGHTGDLRDLTGTSLSLQSLDQTRSTTLIFWWQTVWTDQLALGLDVSRAKNLCFLIFLVYTNWPIIDNIVFMTQLFRELPHFFLVENNHIQCILGPCV